MSLLQCSLKFDLAVARPTETAVYHVDPFNDERWDQLVDRHSRTSVFHSSAWLRALYLTYGYKPIVYTTSSPGQDLQNGIVLCEVKSWLTGKRLVSLPFSDHCEPLVDSPAERNALSVALQEEMGSRKWNYLELRPLSEFPMRTPYCHTAITYAFHQLDLRPGIDEVFRNFHKSSTQRKIRRAEREGLVCREGSTKELLNIFYDLFTLTRKRHGLAPPSKAWFANLMTCFGEALKIRVAFRNTTAVAAILTIRHKDTLTYKYGCSDSQFHPLGCMHFLFWKALQDATAAGLRVLDFGRTNADQQGLITFKNRWGATQSVLTYSRYGLSKNSTHLCDIYSSKRKSTAVKSVLKLVSPAVLPAVGSALYKHIG